MIFRYDPATGQLAQVTRQSGEVVSNTFDPATGDLQTISCGPWTVDVNLSPARDEVVVTERDTSNSVTVSETHPNLSQSLISATTQTELAGGGTASWNIDIERGPSRRQVRTTITSGTHVWEYDRDESRDGFAGASEFETIVLTNDVVNIDKLEYRRHNWFGDSRRLRDTTLDKTFYCLDYEGRKEIETFNGSIRVTTVIRNARGRVASQSVDPGTATNYQWTADGVVSSQSGPGGTTNFTVDPDKRCVTQAGDRGYTRDADGRLTEITELAGTTTYAFQEGTSNLTQAQMPDGTVIDFMVGPTGQTVAKAVDGTHACSFVREEGTAENDAGRLAAILAPDGSFKACFVYEDSTARLPLYMEKDGERFLFVTDREGRLRLVVNTMTCEVVQYLRYDGAGRVETNDVAAGFDLACQPFIGTGLEQCPDTGLSTSTRARTEPSTRPPARD